MTTRSSLHAVVDELEEDELDEALQLLEQVRDRTFDLTPEEREELARREAECDSGQVVHARDFLIALRGAAPGSRR